MIVGVVGVLPVIVEVIKGCRFIVGVRRHMADLEQGLRTEKIVLQNIYERLLNRIVPASKLEALTQMESRTPK